MSTELLLNPNRITELDRQFIYVKNDHTVKFFGKTIFPDTSVDKGTVYSRLSGNYFYLSYADFAALKKVLK